MNDFLAVIMMLFGLVITFRTFGSKYKAILFFASVIFLMGVELYVINHYDLLLPANFSLMTIFATAGGGLIVLFLSNPKNYIFAAGAALSIAAAWISIKVLDPFVVSLPFFLSSFRMKIFWALILIISGVLIWRNFKRDQPPEE